MTASDSAAVGR
jgi:hypothetical protein